MATVAVLKKRAWFIGAGAIFGIVLGLAVLHAMGKSYTSEATIRFNFTREQTSEINASEQVAVMDPMAILNGAVRSINSQSTASAIVARYGLDKEPEEKKDSFLAKMLEEKKDSFLAKMFAKLREALALGPSRPRREVLAGELLSNVSVTNEPRSYIISIAYSARTPETAAVMANAFVSEYLRGQRLTELTDSRARAERELLNLSAVFGIRHPSYVGAQARVENLENQIKALRDGTTDPTQILVGGQSLILAEPSLARVGPNVKVFLILFAGAGLAAATFFVLLRANHSSHWFSHLVGMAVSSSGATYRRSLSDKDV